MKQIEGIEGGLFHLIEYLRIVRFEFLKMIKIEEIDVNI